MATTICEVGRIHYLSNFEIYFNGLNTRLRARTDPERRVLLDFRTFEYVYCACLVDSHVLNIQAREILTAAPDYWDADGIRHCFILVYYNPVVPLKRLP